MKPKFKPCQHPNCPELITSGRFCKLHRKANYNPEIRSRYDSRWEKIRAVYVSRHPLCELCLLKNKLTPVEEVHHKIPLENGGTHDFDNLQSLCKSCHSKITIAANPTNR
jgi:5-methylcytosine-specific restriction protein A